MRKELFSAGGLLVSGRRTFGFRQLLFLAGGLVVFGKSCCFRQEGFGYKLNVNVSLPEHQQQWVIVIHP